MALADFAAVLAGAVVAQAPPPGEFPFPKNANILAELTSTASNWPVVIQHHIDDFVLPQYQVIPGTAISGKTGGAKVAWNTQAQITKIIRKESDVAYTPPPTNSFPNGLFTRFDFKLHQLQDNPGHDIANGFKLMIDYSTAVPKKVPTSAYSSQNAAMQSIKNLAAFEGFCIRLASAINAADRAGVSLAETLALWRTEGDLLAPWSEARRLVGAPTYDVISGIALGVDTAEVFFSMKRGLWTFTYERLIPGFGLPTNAADKIVAENAFKLKAFVQWSLVTAGLDFFWKNIPFNFGNRIGFVNAVAEFLNAHHKARMGAAGDDKPARAADCNAVLNDLECVLPAAANQRVIVTPKDPVKLLSLILGEALIFTELDTTAGKGPVVTPSPKLKYLAYHCQDHRHGSDPAKDKFTLMIVSGAVAAARGPAGALKTSLAPFVSDPLFPKPADLKDLDFSTQAVLGDTSGHVAGYQKLLTGGWFNPANLENLADFMLVATPAQWAGWADLRGNMARYIKLLGYYEKLLS